MPRAQQGGVVQGGGINPFVAQASLQRGEARNRMRETMVKESGAAKRNQDTNAANMAQTQMQTAAARKMQDARAAEVERGRRQDHDYRMVEEEVASNRQAERDKLLNDLTIAREEASIGRVEEIYKEVKAQERYSQISDLTTQDNQAALAKRVAESEGKAETGIEKLETWQLGQQDKHEQMRSIADIISRDISTKLLSSDFAMETDFNKVPEEERMNVSKWDPLGLVGIPSKHKEFKAAVLTKFSNNKISKGVNDFLHSSGVPGEVDIEQFEGEKIKEFEELLRTGKVKGEDILELKTVVGRAYEHFTEKAKDTATTDENARKLYADWAGKMAQVETQLLRLSNSKEPIEVIWGDSGAKYRSGVTVGAEVSRGLGYSRADMPTGEYDRRRAEIQSMLRASLKRLGTPEDQRSVFPTSSSRYLNEMDRANPLLMNKFMSDEERISRSFPQDVPPRETMLGEGGY